jgi:hypothetical protein
MPATLTPPVAGEVVAPAKADPSVSSMIDKFKSRMTGDEPLAKPAEKPVEKSSAKPAATQPAKVEPKPGESKSVVPKLEPLPEKKAEVPPEKPAVTEPKTDGDRKKIPHENFKVLEAARDEFRAKYEAAEKRAKEFEAKLQEQSTRTPPELEEAKKQLEEYRTYIQQHDLERSPEFQNAFDKPIAQTIKDAKDMLGDRGTQLEKILKAPDDEWRNDRIKEFVKELDDDFEKDTVRDAVRTLKKLQRGRSEALLEAADGVKALKELNAKKAADQMAQHKEARTRLAEAALSAASSTLEDFRETDDAEHNKTVAENKAMLRSFVSSDLPPEEFATMATWAVKGYRSRAEMQQLRDRIAMLESEIGKLAGASPDLDGGGGGSDSSDKADTPEKMGARFIEASQRGVPRR